MEERVALGPRSELGKLALDWRFTLTGFSTGILQLMLPGLGAGVTDHSAFFDEPYDRILRSVPRIVASIVAEDSEKRALNVRDYHRDIKGVDAQGRRYHALDPDVYWWAHATFVRGFLQISDVFRHDPLDAVARGRFYAESVEWWRRYGLSMRPVPSTLAEQETAMDAIYRNELEMTPAAERAIDIALNRPPEIPLLPSALSALIGAPTIPIVALTAIGGLPLVVRKRFDIPWSTQDEQAYQGLAVTIRNAGRLLPDRVLTQVMEQFHKQVENATYLKSADRH